MKSFIEYTLLEGITRKKVIRGGVRKIKKISNKDGFKVIDGKETKISTKERLMLRLRNKKSAKKRKGKSATSNRKRAVSMNKRRGM
jgi:hypothetical protein